MDFLVTYKNWFFIPLWPIIIVFPAQKINRATYFRNNETGPKKALNSAVSCKYEIREIQNLVDSFVDYLIQPLTGPFIRLVENSNLYRVL